MARVEVGYDTEHVAGDDARKHVAATGAPASTANVRAPVGGTEPLKRMLADRVTVGVPYRTGAGAVTETDGVSWLTAAKAAAVTALKLPSPG